GVVVPVAHLVLHVLVLDIAASMPDRSGDVVDLHRAHIADHAIVDALDRLALGEVVAVAETGSEAEPLLLCCPGGFHERANANRLSPNLFVKGGLAPPPRPLPWRATAETAGGSRG